MVDASLYLGDCSDRLRTLASESVDLIITSPPYADSRSTTYGGMKPDDYVDWFLPVSAELLRILKPTGTFVLNIKEKVVNGERHTYVIELILAMRRQGWLWTEELSGIRKTAIQVNGRTASVILGNGCCSSTRIGNSTCIKTKSWCRWGIGPSAA